MNSQDCRAAVRLWATRSAVSIGVFAGATAVAVGASSFANADAISDILVAAQVPLSTAQTAITEALPGLGATDMAALTGQSSFLDGQSGFLSDLTTGQESLPTSDVSQLADLDKLLYTTSESLLYHTLSFITAVDTAGPIDQFFAGADMFSADLSALNTDFEVLFGSLLVGAFGPFDLPTALVS